MLRQGFRIIVMLVFAYWADHSYGQTPGFIVITHSSSQATAISENQLRRIFAARQQVWPSGGKITVVMQGHSSSAHGSFCREYLNLFPYQIERLWNQLVFSGQAEAPIIADNDQGIIDIVAQTPGAIAYVSASTDLPSNVQRINVNQVGD